MKQISFKKNLAWLRICTITAALVLVSLFLFSFVVATKKPADFWQQLGLSQVKGSEKIKSSFIYGYLDTWGVGKLRTISASNRASLAKELLAYTKTYLNSAAVKAAFEKERIAAKPVLPELNNITKEEVRKQKINETKKFIADAENIIKQFPDQEKSLRKSINNAQKSIKEFENPTNAHIEMFYQNILRENKQKEEAYKKRLMEWEENYPANHKHQIKKHLQKYLGLANTVDFAAELKEKYGKKVFVKPEYEGKSTDWKAIYRAGEEVYAVTKPFAEQWLKELR